MRAAVVGTGFVGVLHVEALRRLGVEVLGVVGSSPERARAKRGRVPLPEPYESFAQMLADVPLLATGRVDATNAAAFLRAGAAAVGVGSALVAAPDVTAAARDLVGSARDA